MRRAACAAAIVPVAQQSAAPSPPRIAIAAHHPGV
jgi:hypothetical protein